MTESELFVSQQIKTLVPDYDMIDFNATIASSSLSVEFFATVNGKKMQCFEMIDEGMFTENDFDNASIAIAKYFRNLPDFNADGINKYILHLE